MLELTFPINEALLVFTLNLILINDCLCKFWLTSKKFGTNHIYLGRNEHKYLYLALVIQLTG